RSAPPTYGRAGHYAASTVACAAYAAVAGGGSGEMLAGAVAGLGLKALSEFLEGRFPGFLALCLAAFVATVWGVLNGFWFALDAQKIVLGAILPMMPGLSLVGSVRDLIAGDLVSGVARGADALLVASAIAVGVLAGLSLQRTLGW
ncbi:MAG: threonine/serine exporter family protein, partial [Candidatus Eremiobacterota bacterium]